MPSLMCMLNTVSRCAALYQSDRLEGTELKPPHCRYISVLCREPGQSQEQLAKNIFVNKSQVTRHLAYLEEKGYIPRKPGEDKRVLLVYPTEKAFAVLPRIREIFRDWNEWLTAGFTPEEQELFVALMQRAKDRAVSYDRGDDGPPLATVREDHR